MDDSSSLSSCLFRTVVTRTLAWFLSRGWNVWTFQSLSSFFLFFFFFFFFFFVVVVVVLIRIRRGITRSEEFSIFDFPTVSTFVVCVSADQPVPPAYRDEACVALRSSSPFGSRHSAMDHGADETGIATDLSDATCASARRAASRAAVRVLPSRDDPVAYFSPCKQPHDARWFLPTNSPSRSALFPVICLSFLSFFLLFKLRFTDRRKLWR